MLRLCVSWLCVCGRLQRRTHAREGAAPRPRALIETPASAHSPKFPPRSNINTRGSPLIDGLVKKFTVKTVGGYKIGVLGWISPETAFMAANPGGATFEPAVPAVRRRAADRQAVLLEVRNARAVIEAPGSWTATPTRG